MKLLGQVTAFDQPVYIASTPDFTSLPELELPSSQSVVLLVSEAIGISPEIIYSAASQLIERGVRVAERNKHPDLLGLLSISCVAFNLEYSNIRD